jgi:hypothetical protein
MRLIWKALDVKPTYILALKRGNLKYKIIELTTNSKNENIRHLYERINEFRSGYKPRNNLVKDENCNRFADLHNILNRR